ncbi:GNAT family N-acetyltransferase [Pseudarthrobacter oxydans]|uniref:GNAT family N-acetyltransferase n=1 Tax=Pseudarthrobacter oxydans TaxID=1671 RepID=UPI003D29689E
MKRLETERLVLRQWEPEDADFVLDLYSRWAVQRFIGNHPQVMRDRAEAEDRIRTWRSIGQQDMAHPIHGIWAVELKEPPTRATLAGTLLLKSIPASSGSLPLQPSGDTEIGWHFHPDHWGNGYATEAAAAVLAYALDSGLDKVVAVTAPANTASQRVCARIGMTHLGQTDKYYNALCELFEAKAPHQSKAPAKNQADDGGQHRRRPPA